MNVASPRSRPVARMSLSLFALLVAALVALVACGSDDSAGQSYTSCTFDDNCPLGTVCSADGKCIEAACDFCQPDQICYITPDKPEGTCSRPECTRNSDCADGKSCSGGVCTDVVGCQNSTDCSPGEICNLANQCVPDPDACTSNNDCPSGHDCEDSRCVPRTPTSCNDIQCESNERCIPDTLECVRDCVSDSSMCQPNETCNTTSGQCESNGGGNNCPGADPSQCTGATPHFNPQTCQCVGCNTNADCGGGRVCNNGQCMTGQCQQACDPATPGTCGGNTPYCISNCCMECVGAADCPQGQLCLDGFCGVPPNCTADPSVCPAGTECQNGQCQAPQGGQACSQSDPTSCPPGTFCDGSTCQPLGGDFGCGMCNPDCTCDGSLTCDGFFCTGCVPLGLGGPGMRCPSGQSCIPLSLLDPSMGNMCFPI